MPYKPDHWTKTSIGAFYLKPESKIGQGAGWTFWEHPTQGDEHPILAVSLDFIGEHGPVVWNTHDFDVPEYL